MRKTAAEPSKQNRVPVTHQEVRPTTRWSWAIVHCKRRSFVHDFRPFATLCDGLFAWNMHFSDVGWKKTTRNLF